MCIYTRYVTPYVQVTYAVTYAYVSIGFRYKVSYDI